ncbi:HepT-like ribonuclease domain-containing protein [Mucilaginibacter paludis]|uniref:HepT-like ribonuclease domain-containing protein n=1 Tax=Mucilaginibacter paludis TaxID=423351 RepID=UPI0012FACCB6
MTTGKEQNEIVTDPILSRAVIRSLEIIGEASSKLNPEFKAMYPHVEWRKITNTRHRLIHDYFGVDYDIVWNIITDKLPILKVYIDGIISEHS